MPESRSHSFTRIAARSTIDVPANICRHVITKMEREAVQRFEEDIG